MVWYKILLKSINSVDHSLEIPLHTKSVLIKKPYLRLIYRTTIHLRCLKSQLIVSGPSAFAGLAIMVILVPINIAIANRVKSFQMKQMKYKDDRVKLMNEVLSGVKVRPKKSLLFKFI